MKSTGVENAGLENAGLENAGPNRMGRNRGTGRKAETYKVIKQSICC